MPTGTGLAKAFFALITNTVYCSTSLGKDNGFGNNYIWASSLESGIQLASRHKKPVMVIIHKSWCKACKNLKPKFANCSEIQSLSRKFVMVNLLDDEEPENNLYAPDGTYIPRILFMSPHGKVDHEIYNEDGSSQHKFFYSRPEQIAKSMKKVLEKYNLEQFDV
ncbi:thioredoxin domain-containing protein 12-like [Leguminivora glycinivorella]|uniref:thioredoxin domain-containing protein 12-like n=1 Tax=Leguminivora glycinivorella TaxID=1035111 RepID=UPI0020107663|nr:thioredoxin domain-containing protein 12-like [Leguminivora glycinivorella]